MIYELGSEICGREVIQCLKAAVPVIQAQDGNTRYMVSPINSLVGLPNGTVEIVKHEIVGINITKEVLGEGGSLLNPKPEWSTPDLEPTFSLRLPFLAQKFPSNQGLQFVDGILDRNLVLLSTLDQTTRCLILSGFVTNKGFDSLIRQTNEPLNEEIEDVIAAHMPEQYFKRFSLNFPTVAPIWKMFSA